MPPPYIVAGHLLGGMVARVYAARHPDRMAGLVLVDTLRLRRLASSASGRTSESPGNPAPRHSRGTPAPRSSSGWHCNCGRGTAARSSGRCTPC
ncbi:alpha/beta fold hydrolase [Pseudarthrobacter sp. S9]|uniref:alpha/beta fold hydrolase n=1 Tax=Pseudarthrobacter sp. S9 TaxID=3418421 RepID=UPI003CFF5E5C